jgi:hypothetical protein
MTTSTPALFTRPARKARTTRGRTLRIVPYRNSLRVYGTHLVPLFDGAQVARQYSHQQRCWLVNRQHLDQLATYAEHAEGRIVTIEEEAR